MNILQITPGAGDMYCGACLRDNALVKAFRQQGHTATLLPLYLPLTLDEPDQSRGTPIFFGGFNVYLEQRFSLFRRLPPGLTRWLDSPRLLGWVRRFAARTRPEEVGELTISMLRGEEGKQAVELDRLLDWVQGQPGYDVINLSNVLLIGLVRRLRNETKLPVVVTLQGEDTFLDQLPPENREEAWNVLGERAREADRFIAPSAYYGRRMQERMAVESEKIRVVPNGINLEGFELSPAPYGPPVLGFFARMCSEKGLDVLFESFLLLRRRESTRNLRLKIGGSCGPADEPLVTRLQDRCRREGLAGEVEWSPNLSRSDKIGFLRQLTIYSVPALYGESFGLYVLEAMAAGVPVVQPRHAAFTEIVEDTGGGILCEPGDPAALADGIESLLTDPEQARQLGTQGRQAVQKKYSVEAMADRVLGVYRELG